LYQIHSFPYIIFFLLLEQKCPAIDEIRAFAQIVGVGGVGVPASRARTVDGNGPYYLGQKGDS
jgi:hypothetical protein